MIASARERRCRALSRAAVSRVDSSIPQRISIASCLTKAVRRYASALPEALGPGGG